MKRWITGGLVLVAVALVVTWWPRAPDASGAGTHASAGSASGGAPGRRSAAITSRTAANLGVRPTHAHRPSTQPAWQTMAHAREHGDDRAPPIERPAPESQAPAPTAWDLSDPARYREYERRGQQRLRAEYLAAVEVELPRWKALLAQARATGAPRAAIAEAQDKIRHLEARQAMLRNSPPDH